MRGWKIIASALAVSAALAAPARAQVPAACAADTPAAMKLAGLPDIAVPGREYTVALVANPASTASPVERSGSDLGVIDTSGRGWSAHYQFVRGVAQAFSVGLDRAPFTVTGAYVESDGAGSCRRTLSAQLPIVRRILAVVNCRRGVEEPSSGLVLRCDGSRLRLRRLSWRNWNADTTTATGKLAGRDARVTLSRPRECSTLDGFIYTRARVRSNGRTTRAAIDCPIDPGRR